jgi:hypothetical protein
MRGPLDRSHLTATPAARSLVRCQAAAVICNAPANQHVLLIALVI